MICTLVITAAIFYTPAGRAHHALVSHRGCEGKVRVVLRGSAPKKVDGRELQVAICPRPA